MSEFVTIEYVGGVEGNSINLNDVRIAGPKAWGGGRVLKAWTVKRNTVLRALGDIDWMDFETRTLRSLPTEEALLGECRDALRWSLDLIEMYDSELIRRGDDPEQVKSWVHTLGLTKATEVLIEAEAALRKRLTPADAPEPTEDDAERRASFEDAVSFLYNSQHSDLGFSKEKALRAGIYADSLRAALSASQAETRALREANATVCYVNDEYGNVGAKMLVYLDQHGLGEDGNWNPPADSIYVNGWTKNPPANGERIRVTLSLAPPSTEEG